MPAATKRPAKTSRHQRRIERSLDAINEHAFHTVQVLEALVELAESRGLEKIGDSLADRRSASRLLLQSAIQAALRIPEEKAVLSAVLGVDQGMA